MENLLLGIDIGTSTIKAALLHQSSLKLVDKECSVSLGPHLTVPEENSHYERGVHDIFTCLDECLASLDSALLQSVVGIGVCGQMHGCVLWRSGGKGFQVGIKDGILRVDDPSSCSSLITWQDGRCSPEFLSSLPKTGQPTPISTGYGCATLAWLKQFKPEIIDQFDRAGTIMDLIVWALCSGHCMKEEEEMGKGVVMSAQNANSWGYFDIAMAEWELEM
jgi:sedoheptulokinase